MALHYTCANTLIRKISIQSIFFLLPIIALPQLPGNVSPHPVRIYSPSKKIQVWFVIDTTGVPGYNVFYNGQRILHDSHLGLQCKDEDFSKDMRLISISP